MMQQQKNMIWKHGSQVMEPTENWYLVLIAQITNLDIWKFDVDLRKL